MEGGCVGVRGERRDGGRGCGGKGGEGVAGKV